VYINFIFGIRKLEYDYEVICYFCFIKPQLESVITS